MEKPDSEDDGVYREGVGLRLNFLHKEEPVEKFSYEEVSESELQELKTVIEELDVVATSFIEAGRSQYYAELDNEREKAAQLEITAKTNLEKLIASREVILRSTKIWGLSSDASRIGTQIAQAGFPEDASYAKSANELSRDILFGLVGRYNEELAQGDLSGAYPLSQLAKITSKYPNDQGFADAHREVQGILLGHISLLEQSAEKGARNRDSFLSEPSFAALSVLLEGDNVSSERAARAIAKTFVQLPDGAGEEYFGVTESHIQEIFENNLGFAVVQEDEKESMDFTGPARLVMEHILEEYHLDPKQYIRNWANAAFDLGFDEGRPMTIRTDFLADNLKRMRAFESKQPGMSKTLQEEFNLTCLGRYPEEDLVRQYEERDQVGEYYPAFLAVADHNGAMGDRGKYNHARQILEKEGRKVPLRFMEFADAQEGKMISEKMKKKYGPILFGSVDVHGEKDAILTTGIGLQNKKGAKFGKEDLAQNELGVFSAFAPGSCIALNSCSTGAEGGFAQELSRVGSFIVKAPDIPAGCTHLDVKILPDGKIDLLPEYRGKGFSPATRKTYNNGILVDSFTPGKLFEK